MLLEDMSLEEVELEEIPPMYPMDPTLRELATIPPPDTTDPIEIISSYFLSSRPLKKALSLSGEGKTVRFGSYILRLFPFHFNRCCF